MKKITYTFSFLAVLLLGFTSCSSEIELVTQSENQSANQNCTVSFTLNNGGPSTRTDGPSATNDFTTAALAREKAISYLYALAFRKEGDAFYKMIKVELPTESQSYTFNMQQSGEFEFVLLANPAESLVNELTAKTAEFTLTDFPSVLVTQEPGEKVGEESGLTNFFMTSEVKTNISVTANTTLELGAIELTRLAARYDFYNQVNGLEMTGITFTRRPAQSYMVKPMSQSGLTFTSDKEYTSANGVTAFTSIGAIYSYEDIADDDCALTLHGLLDGQPISKLIKFEERNIRRNCLYNIIITENDSPVTPDPHGKDDQLTFEVRVADWTTGEEISFTGDDLVNKEAPTFEASGSGVMTTSATESTPAVVRVPKEATTVTITAISASSADSQLTFVGELPAGWSIAEQIPTDINAKDGHLTHQFTIEMTENTAENSKVCTFKLSNIFDPTANVTFTLAQDGIFMFRNPLRYVAEYNLLSPGVFTTEQSIEIDKNGSFTWDQVHSGEIVPTGYHVPSGSEFKGVLLAPGSLKDSSDKSEGTILIHGRTFTDLTYDCKKDGYNIFYALRFKDASGQVGPNTCAFRYQFENNKGLIVSCRALDASFSGDIDTISDEAYWNSDIDILTCLFPFCGYKDSVSGPINSRGSFAFYWASDEFDATSGADMHIYSGNIYFTHDPKICCMPVRVFYN